ESMVEVVMTTFGVSPGPGLPALNAIIEFLRSKNALVIVDNCEHVLDSAATLIDQLLRNCPRVRVLATSREVLSVAGEHVFGLRSLAVGDDGSDAVQLFVDRAIAIRPDFHLDDANADALREICRRLDGIPLAIELAAARVLAMQPTEIAAMLDERFRLLTGGRRATLERHHTLRA